MASFGVVLVHTSMFALGQAPQLDSLGWWHANLGNSLGRNASMLFVMVAGAILLARPIDGAPGAFVRKRLSRIVPALVFWSVFYFLWRAWRGEPLTATVVGRDVLAGQPYFHLWFLYAMAGLYLLMPAARVLVSDERSRSVAWLTLAVSMGYAWVFTTQLAFELRLPLSFVALTPLLLPYLLGGYFLYHAPQSLSTGRVGLLAGGALLGIMALMAWLYPGSTPSTAALMQFLRAPLAFVWTFALFALLLRLRPTGWRLRAASTIAPVTLGIYAIHPFWVDLLGRLGFGITEPGHAWLAYSLIVYMLSLASALLISRVPLLRRVVH